MTSECQAATVVRFGRLPRRHTTPSGGSSKGRRFQGERLQTDKDALAVVGRRYGRLEVVGVGPRTVKGKRTFVCRCDCGIVKPVAWASLKSGAQSSCGCLRDERRIETQTKHGESQPTEYMYRLWKGIRWRLNPKYRRYETWGGRGITLYGPWNDYVTFKRDILAEIGERPSPSHSLDRIDNNGNYEPGNVRWATALIQSRNRRRNNRYTAGRS